ncbi:triose-phosphate isomerase [Mycoplasmopsis cricetuli]|uniref:triose-phosphate isomerase n=1 Tax=Mycoplasmopsis cricetuli TaxID=171283 RepID=UPI0004716FD8|nr:triose-phosphate isomerase [Mycoplasmopsis cricetuli]
MNKLIIIGNWKMNKTFTETKNFIHEFSHLFKKYQTKITSNIEFGIAVPSINLAAFQSNEIKQLGVAAQNVSKHIKGAYTGEVSIDMLKDLNVKYVILGHSERRMYHQENDFNVNLKAKLALEKNITPIICVGETLEQYEQGITKKIIEKQIKDSLKDLPLDKIIVAYEPVWAIGTGKVATPEIAQEICEFIHKITNKNLIVQYGGSVSPTNIELLSKQNDINGFLVGGASLEASSFIQLLTLGQK